MKIDMKHSHKNVNFEATKSHTIYMQQVGRGLRHYLIMQRLTDRIIEEDGGHL